MDPDFVPSKPLVDEIEKQNKRSEMDKLTDFLETERIHYQTSSDIKTMSPLIKLFCAYLSRVAEKLNKQVLYIRCSWTRARHVEYFGRKKR